MNDPILELSIEGQEEDVVEFKESSNKGNIGEQIFKEDYLDFLNISATKADNEAHTCDFASLMENYEVKANYKDDAKIVIEEDHNIDESLGQLKKGWIYTSTASTIAFVSVDTRTMIICPMALLKQRYNDIKDKYQLFKNQMSNGLRGDKWISTYRRINLSDLRGCFCRYKKY